MKKKIIIEEEESDCTENKPSQQALEKTKSYHGHWCQKYYRFDQWPVVSR